ncbi:hypothetical protein AGOR_G00190240 [Albula goreensis]|uniref:C2H2-type domain-containing protein n=1 Tax=Albula goreensis TaxID=1534307 RepID=A0A8T3CQR1_9TELE|nr:hypothetical protein AGOR_G00190240 [Albula goreensis]
MPRRKQDQPKRLPSHVDGTEEGRPKGPTAPEEDGWFGNASDSPSESSYGGDEATLEQDTSGESSAGCPTPVLLGSAQDTLSSVVSSLFGDASQTLGSNLRRLLEAGELTAQGRGRGLPTTHLALPLPLALPLSPSSNHAQQLSALARKLANSTRSATPSPSPTSLSIKQDTGGRFSPAMDANGGGAGGGSLVWAGGSEAWPPGGCSASSSLSPDSAILKLKAAANAVLQDKSSAAAMASSSSSCPSSSSSSSSSSISSVAGEEAGRFDAFAPPFSTQSASSTLAALSKKVSERGLSGTTTDAPAGTFLSLASMTSSAALLKEVAARAAGSLLSEKKELPLVLGPPEDTSPLPDKNHNNSQNRNSALDLLPTTPTRGKAKTSSQGGSPEDGGKPFQCPVCGLVIKRKSYWKRHMVIHTGVKSHQCPLCPFRCARKDNLKSHMKVHQHQDRGETFQCQQCPFTSSRHFSLKLHMRCHQHCPGEAQVKDEAATDTEDEAGPQGSMELASSSPRLLASPPGGEASASSNHVLVKEEPLEEEVPDMSAKTATDLLIKLSAANQKEALKGPVCVKEEPQAEGMAGPAQITQRPRETGSLPKSGLLTQDIGNKVASELLMKLSAEKKEVSFQQVTVKVEPMEVDPPKETSPTPTPTPSHLLGFGALPGVEKSEPLTGFSNALGSPQRALFCEDISVKMASELLFKLSERVSKAKNHKDSSLLGVNSSFSDDRFGQPLSDSSSKPCSSSDRVLPDSGQTEADVGDRTAPWRGGEQLYPCGVCGKVFGRQQTLTHHLSVHTEERKYGCHLCPYTAKCKANLQQHLTIHSAEPGSTDAEDDITTASADRSQRTNCPFYYNCLMCGFQTGQNAQFISHMTLHMDREQWMFSLCCTACDFVCSDQSEMAAHVSTGHTGLHPRSPLSETKSTSSSLSTLSDSVNGIDGSELLAPPSSSSSKSGSGMEEKPEKGFECVFCTFTCQTRPVYERHLQIHLISRMFECDVCHEFLKTPQQLLEHKKCHTAPSGGLKCPLGVCSPERPDALDSRLKRPGEKRFKCQICQASAGSQPELEEHVRGHHAAGRHRCEQCGHLARTAGKLAEHVRVHTGERPFRCDRCSYRCRRKDNLGLHKRLKHGVHHALSSAGPCVLSRPGRKHRRGGGGGARGGDSADGRGGDSGSPPLLSMSASLALQSVALSVSSRGQSGSSSPQPSHYLPAPNGRSLSWQYERYRTCDPAAHLVPLTTLFNSARFGRAQNSSSLPTLGLRPSPACSPAMPSLSPTSQKHSFLAYLGLAQRVQTV